MPLEPLPSCPLLPVPQFQTVPSLRTLEVCMRPAAMAFTPLRKDSATTVLKELAELFDGLGSVRKLVAEALFCNVVPGAAVTFATIVKLIALPPGDGSTVAVLPVIVPLVPTVGPVQVAAM